MSSFVPHNLFIIGGTGDLGGKITAQLLAKKAFNVKILVRKDTLATKKDLVDKFKAAGGVIVEGDLNDTQFLTEALKGSDTLISTVSGGALFGGSQDGFLKAAVAAGVRRFLPSEFGVDYTDKTNPFFAQKAAFREKLEASGLEYTYVITGGFYEFVFGPFSGFFPEQARATIPGDGNQVISTTHTEDIARYLPEILLDRETKNQKVYLAGSKITLKDAVKIFEEESGKKFELVHEKLEDLKAFFEGSDPDFVKKFVAYLKYLEGTGRLSFEGNDATKYPHIKPMSVRDYAKAVYHKSG